MTFKNFIVTIQSFDGVQEQNVSANPMTIGRSYSVDLPLILTEVSRCHLKVYWQNSQIFIEDLGSKNGTFLNGKLIEANTLVTYTPGDEVTLGHTDEKLKFEIEYLAAEKAEPAKSSEPPPLEPLLQTSASSASVQSLTHKVEDLQRDIRELESEKEKLVTETSLRTEKLNQLNEDIHALETAWKTKTQDLLHEQEQIKLELQKELVEMKKLFDSRNAELSNLQEKIQSAKLEDEELSQRVEQRSRLLKETEEEAERFFIERQNELLQEKQRVENLKEIRTLEVEMEMADLKAKKIEELEKLELVQLEDIEGSDGLNEGAWKVFNLSDRQRRLAGFAVMAVLIMMVSLLFKPSIQTTEMASQEGCSVESP